MSPILKPEEIDALLALFKQKNKQIDSYVDVENSKSSSENDDESSDEAKQI